MENKHRIEIPEINKDSIASRDVMRKMGSREGEIYKFPYEKVVARPGFNSRIEYGDLEGLADSLYNNGQETPFIVDVVVIDGEEWAYINEGHRRKRAFGILIERGLPVDGIKCIVNPKGTTEEDRIFKIFVTQDSKPLTPIEIAECFLRLEHLGHTAETISKRIGKSITHVKDYLTLAKEPIEIKNHVIEHRLSASAAIVLTKKVGSEKKRKEMISTAISDGKKFKVKDATKLEPGSPDFITQRVVRLADFLITFLPDYKQAEIRGMCNFLMGISEEADLLDIWKDIKI